MVAAGGEALGGVVGAFRHMIQTESFFSLYKGLVPATYLQMQSHARKLSTVATCVKIIEQGGVPALYAGFISSLLQVLPSAGISYFVYEFIKVVMKVESTQ
ncbi:hypothetical protein Bca4012_005446 [Brassica carinata]